MPGPESALEIALRDARASDEAALTLLMQTYHHMGAHAAPGSRRDVRVRRPRTRLCAIALAEFTVATLREDGPIVGMVHVTDDFIDALHVAPAAQRRGVGAMLLAHAQAQMRANGHRLARLETDTFNRQSRDFYARHGFAEVAQYPDEEWDSGFTTVLLTKPL
jgi:ribosomal protein S18 acetylase RimI-like enzyme